MKDSLNPQQARFVQYYIETGNAKASALNAGYSKSTANNANAALLRNSAIQGEVEKHEKYLIKSSGWNKARLVSEIEGVFHKALEDQQLQTALKSLELIGKVTNVMPSAKTMQVKHTFESLLDQSTTTKDITPQHPEITIN
jgi:phage terminase small subunit|tara:strand:+ start:137 stop:559 length:423 start_codon:yes stop_codon:yes gene_type:complete